MKVPVSLVFALLLELAAVAYCAALMPSGATAGVAGGLISAAFLFALVTR
jgi:hypothetical protein